MTYVQKQAMFNWRRAASLATQSGAPLAKAVPRFTQGPLPTGSDLPTTVRAAFGVGNKVHNAALPRLPAVANLYDRYGNHFDDGIQSALQLLGLG